MVCFIALLAVSSVVIHCRLALIGIVQLMATESTNATVAKRPRVTNSISPDRRDSLIQELPGNKCPHCRKACTCKSEVLQCGLCAVWLHTHQVILL